MNDEMKNSIAKLEKIKNILEGFSTREEAVEYLVNETRLSKEECATAYDFFMKINLKK